ncbi:MAG: heat-inducible transcriptional repressor HrcA [Acidimicrobiales bacterium]
MDDRKASILRAVVQLYISTDQPVGSGRVASAAGITVSAATVRNEMAALEHDGYLYQPHTSAGRVPTEAGYRLFVDSLLASPGTLGAAQVRQVRSFFGHTNRELEGMLSETSELLAGLTNMAAVVVAPDQEHSEVRSVQLVFLHTGVALLVVVHSNAAVDKATIKIPESADEATLREAGRILERRLLDGSAAPANDEKVDSVLASADEALGDMTSREQDSVFVGGTSRMVARFEAVETVGRVLEILDQQIIVVSLLQDLLDRGMSVAIGTESGVAPLAECSIVVSPYEVEGESVGTIGVLGPTRMNYSEALAAVALVSRRLGRSLSESTQ